MTQGVSIDFETASKCDLRRTGVIPYARDPSTLVLCLAWKFDGEPVQSWRIGQSLPPARLFQHVHDGKPVRAWNAEFEFWIWNEVFRYGPRLTREQLDDTMARAAYWGLPLKLEQAAEALNLATQKDAAGHRLMLQMCKPRPDGTWWHEQDPAKLDRLVAYCETDVDVEEAIAAKLPPMPARERSIWLLDKRINERGVSVDLELAAKLQAVTKQAQAQLAQRMHVVTKGTVTSPNQTSQVLAFAKAAGYPHDNLQKDTIRARLKELDPAPSLERDILQVRREAARASTAKLSSLQKGAFNGQLYGLLQHYGASRTGRWAGRIFQPQNLPRPTIKNVDRAIEGVMAGLDADALELFFEDSALGVVASCLRGTLVASPGNLLVSADLAQIEARVIAWLGGQQDILDVFARGEDVYVYTAAKVGSTDRQLGKVLVLACGFGMGPNKFQDTAKTYGMSLTPLEAQGHVYAWRGENPAICDFWWNCDAAARDIASGDKGPIHVGPVSFRRRGATMLIRLPSGRDLVYRGIGMEWDREQGRDAITYWGVNQYTRKWTRIRTYGGKLAENITQAIARDVMADAMLELDRQDVDTRLTVHDELIAEADQADADDTLQLMLDVLGMTPSWAPGLPVAAAGWAGPRYRKG